MAAQSKVFPEWLLESKERGRLKVTFKENSKQELVDLVTSGKLDFYDKCEDIEQVIKEVFELNPHSVHTLNKHKEGIYAIALDNLNIVYTMDEKKTEVHVVKILYSDAHSLNESSYSTTSDQSRRRQAPDNKLRTKQWLEKMNEIMDFRGIKVDKKEEDEEDDEDYNDQIQDDEESQSPQQTSDAVANKDEEEKEAS